MRLTTYSLGCSIVAMFNRVAGGNYTKAADISADIVGKNVHNLPEDDSRMPNTVADFIGDCVNDIAGNVSDLLESFVATPLSAILSASRYFGDYPAVMTAACVYPFIIATGGLVASVCGVEYIILRNRKKKRVVNGQVEEYSRETNDPELELDIATYVSAGTVLVIGLVASKVVFGGLELPSTFRFGWLSPWIATLFGLFSSVAIGKLTEVYTALKSRAVKSIADIAPEGEAFVITKGDAVGENSVFPPAVVLVISIVVAAISCGVYGLAIAGLGMLSFVGTTVSIDAFGPIADNAGGIAESCHLDPEVRVITNELDAVGNTTAAIGKGNAIGSAALATTALILSYVGSYPMADYSNPEAFVWLIIWLIAGGILGMALVKKFEGLLSNNTIDSSKKMADAGEKQFEDDPLILDENEPDHKPDYQAIIVMASDEALRKMLLPSILALIVPIVGGFSLGPDFILGVLLGSTLTAIGEAIFMGNSGGAWDNGKKRYEAGLQIKYDRKGQVILAADGTPAIWEKGSAPHKAAVVGDTTGDTRKDVVGVALDIFIKMMSTVANSLSMMFYTYRIFT